MTGRLLPSVPQVRENVRLQIVRHLEDVITPSGSNALFICRSEGPMPTRVAWHKDGFILGPIPRYRMSGVISNFELEIFDVTEEDYGLYSITLENGYDYLYSKGRLFIAPDQPTKAAMYVLPLPRRVLQVVKPLHPLVIRRGSLLHLEPVFRTQSVHFYWYKNNVLQRSDGSYRIIDSTLSSSLTIAHCQYIHSGVYCLLNRTQYGIISLIVDILVVDRMPQNIIIPSIEESLPEDLTYNMGDEVNLILRVSADGQTAVDWCRRRVLVAADEGIYDYYGEGYIGLRLPNATEESAEEYTVTLSRVVGNEVKSVESSCCLSLNCLQIPRNLPSAELKMPLMSVLTLIGAKVVFHCRFALSEYKHFYVVWKIGRYIVQSSNSQFRVSYHGGDYLLYIPCVRTGMIGSVICELRVGIPHRRSAFVCYSHSHLAVLPPKSLEEQSNRDLMYHKPKLYQAGASRSPSPGTSSETESADSGTIPSWDEPEMLTLNKKSQNTIPHDSTIEILYCRFDDGYYYLFATVDGDIHTNHVKIEELKDLDEQDTYDVSISWDNVITPLPQAFLIEWCDSTDIYCSVGITTMPCVEIKSVPVGSVVKIRVVFSESKPTTSVLHLEIQYEDYSTEHQSRPGIRTMAEYRRKYANTDTIIGAGAFGCVTLVTYKNISFAAKIIKTRLNRKRTVAIREYDVMRKLCNPRVCSVYAAFQDDASVILIMEYLWGGELFERILEAQDVKEVDVIPYVRQICEGLKYMHAMNIVHLDLKPENVVCVSPNSNQIKIIDFGLARELGVDASSKVLYGTRDYIAPEVLNYDDLTIACDMWSLGVLTYVLLTGDVPFAGEDWAERLNNILLGRYNYEGVAVWETSQTAKLFVDRLLVPNPDRRMTAAAALKHAWLEEGPSAEELAADLKISKFRLRTYLENTKAGRRWQRVGNLMIAAHRLRWQPNKPAPYYRAAR